jgi:adenylosuccinate lyase
MRAFAGEGEFKTFLLADTDVRSLLSEADIVAQFDLEHALASTAAIVDRALGAAS